MCFRGVARWIWPRIMQKELDKYRELTNNRVITEQMIQGGTGALLEQTPNFLYDSPGAFQVGNQLSPVDEEIGEDIIRDLESMRLMDWDVPEEIARDGEDVLKKLGMKHEQVGIKDAWLVFACFFGSC